MSHLYDELSVLADTEVNMPLSAMTTLRIGGYAKYVVYPKTDIALDSILRILKEKNVPYKLIGKGSDLLCSDDPYDGVVIRLDRFMNSHFIQEDEIVVEAGCSLIALSFEAMKSGLSGLEFASGIPGTIGGAVFMNAGAYKSDMSKIIEEVFVYRNEKMEWIPNEECEFSYRTSVFQKHPDWIILGAKLKMEHGNSEEIAALMKDRKERRMASQPLEYPTCGSVFRNPEGDAAWRLIEGIGFRGRTIGGASVSDKHCNFIVNKDHASANDYMKLVKEIQQAVYEKYGIQLETEMEKFNWK